MKGSAYTQLLETLIKQNTVFRPTL